jgi:hypothetical protein
MLIISAAVATEKVLLVPYSAHHVPMYHEWIKDPVRVVSHNEFRYEFLMITGNPTGHGF